MWTSSHFPLRSLMFGVQIILNHYLTIPPPPKRCALILERLPITHSAIEKKPKLFAFPLLYLLHISRGGNRHTFLLLISVFLSFLHDCHLHAWLWPRMVRLCTALRISILLAHVCLQGAMSCSKSPWNTLAPGSIRGRRTRKKVRMAEKPLLGTFSFSCI